LNTSTVFLACKIIPDAFAEACKIYQHISAA